MMTRPPRSLSLRLFVTCWLIFCLHFATDIVREHYLAFSLAEDYSFRMDKYLGLHIDIFDLPGYGAHIDNNPGVSMAGAIPYMVTRPIIDRVVAAINARRAASGQPITAIYNDPRPRRVEFFRRVREQGLDIRFGLASAAMHVLFGAPLSAFAAVVMLRLLLALGLTTRTALLGAFLYALGTPVFFRTAFLNQNIFIAHLTLFALVALWRPGGLWARTDRNACLVAGALGGISLLSDFSGGLVLGWFGLYAAWLGWRARGHRGLFENSVWFTAGAIGPILLLLFYQYRAFGSPWYPAQHYMPPAEGSEAGYQGVGLPQWRLFRMLLIDTRFGLLTSCPWLVLSAGGLILLERGGSWIPRIEGWLLAAFSLSFIVFFSGVGYTVVQWVTGVRYLLPIVPALFLLAFSALLRLPPLLRYTIVVLAFAESWCLSMVRAIGIADSVTQVMLGGFQLPSINVLSKMAPQYLPFLEQRMSPLPLFILMGFLIYGIWRYPSPEPYDTASSATPTRL
jgi:hypothetical protein